MFYVAKPRRFVAAWLRYHRENIISVKQLVYLHTQGR